MAKQRISYLVFGILDLLIAAGFILSQRNGDLGIRVLYPVLVIPMYGIAHGIITYELTRRVVLPNLIFYLLLLPVYAYFTLVKLTGIAFLVGMGLAPLYFLPYIAPSVAASLISKAISKDPKPKG